jgi:hypothetical protein
MGSESWLEPFKAGLETLAGALRDDVLVCGANIAYDFACACQADPELLPLVFAHYDRGGVFDVLINQALAAIAAGHLFQDPLGGPLRMIKPDGSLGAVSNRYSLEIVNYLNTGRIDAKANDIYRQRYGTLAQIPIEQWPEIARQYPIDDVVNTDRNAEIQLTSVDRAGLDKFQNVNVPILRYRPAAGLHDMEPFLASLDGRAITHGAFQARAAWALHLASVWGMRTDPAAVVALRQRVEQEREAGAVRLKELKLWTPDGKEDQGRIKYKVAVAFGADPNSKCAACGGSGKVVSPKSGNPINCKVCSKTGLHIPPTVPMTPTGGVKADRDTLEHSHDPDLELLASAGFADKIIDTYLPVLEEASRVPLNTRPNVLIASARASYDGLVQTFPRAGGVRETFIPRPRFLFVSCDYSALELSTLSQVCLWTVGYSRLAEAINGGKDPHAILGANLCGVSYEQFKAALTDSESKDRAKGFRFGAKAGNFGFAGLMGPAKFVLTQRVQKLAGHGSLCRVLGREPKSGCGSTKLYEWRGREVPPVCEVCVEVAVELKEAWLTTWPEMNDYFEFIKRIPGVEEGAGVIMSPGTGYVRGGLTAPEAANHCFQHLAAMGAKHALYNTSRECYAEPKSPLYGSRPILFAHDEIFGELPEDRAHEAAHRLSEVMTESMRVFVPDVDVKAPPAIMRRWYKAAEPVYVDGRLVPWEPKK